jgi:peptidoglycan/xylan/chitin deacetylase (PgdA/CDA1 family)/lipoprotein-anchoring transpeptidase ErfK/SrfK
LTERLPAPWWRTARMTIAVVAGTALLVGTLVPHALAVRRPPSEWVVGPQKRIAVITFEGKTGKKQLRYVLRVLKNRRAKASFFFPGRWVDRHEGRARRVRRRGHALGNRGYRKTLFTRLDESGIRNSIRRSQRALRRVGAHPKPWLRLPRGRKDLRSLAVAGSMGYRAVRWTQHPGRGRAARIRRRVVRRAQGGSIIALDLYRKSNRRALPGILRGLRRRGFEFRTIASLKRSHAVRWDVTLRAGATGPEVAYLEKTLEETSYSPGPRDATFDYPTLQAVYAFEKTHRLTRDGVVTPSQMTRLAVSRRPRAPRHKGRANFVDIDISRQVLFEVRKRKVRHTLPISSGNEENYVYNGVTYTAHTPRGAFVVERKIAGWRTSHLGRLYFPSYFVGGFAVHGSPSVPTSPASHGCVRLPMFVAKGFFYRNPIGRAVFVHD